MCSTATAYFEASKQASNEVLHQFLILICLQEMLPVLYLQWCGYVLG